MFEVMLEDRYMQRRIIHMKAKHRGEALYKGTNLHPDCRVIGIREKIDG